MSHQPRNPMSPMMPHPTSHRPVLPHGIPPGISYPRQHLMLNTFLSQQRNTLASQHLSHPGFNQLRGLAPKSDLPIVGDPMPGARPWLPRDRLHNTPLPRDIGFNPTLSINPAFPGDILLHSNLGNTVHSRLPVRPELRHMANLPGSHPLRGNSRTTTMLFPRSPVDPVGTLNRLHNAAPLRPGFNHASSVPAHGRYFPPDGPSKDTASLDRFHDTTSPRSYSNRMSASGKLLHNDSSNPLHANHNRVVSSQAPFNKLPHSTSSVHSNAPHHGITSNTVTRPTSSNKSHDTRVTTYDAPRLPTRQIAGSDRPSSDISSLNPSPVVTPQETSDKLGIPSPSAYHTQPLHSKTRESTIPLHGKPSRVSQGPPDKVHGAVSARSNPDHASGPSNKPFTGNIRISNIPSHGNTSHVTSQAPSDKSHGNASAHLDSSHTSFIATEKTPHPTCDVTSNKPSSQISRSEPRNVNKISSSNTTLSTTPSNKITTTTSPSLRSSSVTDTTVGKAIPTITSHVRPDNARVTEKTKDTAGDLASHSGAHNNLVLTGKQRRITTSVGNLPDAASITNPPAVFLPGTYNPATYSPFVGWSLTSAELAYPGYSAPSNIRMAQHGIPLNPVMHARLYPNVVGNPHLLSYSPIAPVAPLPRDAIDIRPSDMKDEQTDAFIISPSHVDRKLSSEDRRASSDNDDWDYSSYDDREERRRTPDSRFSRRVGRDSTSREIYTHDGEEKRPSRRKRRHSSDDGSAERRCSKESLRHSRRRDEEFLSFEDGRSDDEVDLIDFVASFERGKKRRTETDRRERRREDRSVERRLAGSREGVRSSSRREEDIGYRRRDREASDDGYNKQRLPFFGGIDLLMLSDESASPRPRSPDAGILGCNKDDRRRDERSLSPFRDEKYDEGRGEEKTSGFWEMDRRKDRLRRSTSEKEWTSSRHSSNREDREDSRRHGQDTERDIYEKDRGSGHSSSSRRESLTDSVKVSEGKESRRRTKTDNVGRGQGSPGKERSHDLSRKKDAVLDTKDKQRGAGHSIASEETKHSSSEKERALRHNLSEMQDSVKTNTRHETRRRGRINDSVQSTKGDAGFQSTEGSRRDDKDTKTRYERSSREKYSRRRATTESGHGVQNKERGSNSRVTHKGRNRSDPEYKSRSSSCYCLPEPNVRRTMVYEKSPKYYKTPETSTTKSTSVGTSELEKLHHDFEENVCNENSEVSLSDTDVVFEVIDEVEDDSNYVTELLDDNEDRKSDEETINLDGYTIVDDDDDDVIDKDDEPGDDDIDNDNDHNDDDDNTDVIDDNDDEANDDDQDDVIDNDDDDNLDDDDDNDDDDNNDVMDNNDDEANDDDHDDNNDDDNNGDIDDGDDVMDDDDNDHAKDDYEDDDNDHNDFDIIDDIVDVVESNDDIDIDDNDASDSCDDIDNIDHIESYNKARSNGLHHELWYNVKGEVNQGKECKCKPVNKTKWIIHDIYPNEEKPEMCEALGNNSLKLYHYWVTMSPQSNFMTERPSRIEVDGETYTFEGFSLLTHSVLDSVPPCYLTRFNIKYRLFFVQEPIPDNFCIKDLDLFTTFLFRDILELYDWNMNEKDTTEGCNLFHFLPRFTRVVRVTDEGHEEHELLSMSQVLKHLTRSYHPLFQDVDLKDKEAWRDFSDSSVNMLATNACSKPKSLRIDEIKHLGGKTHPVIVHHGIRPVQLSFSGNLRCQKMVKAYTKLRTLITNRPNASNSERLKLLKMKLTLDNMRMKESLRRDCCVEVSASGMRKTGLNSDVTQHAMLLPVLVHHIRYHLSLRSFDTKFGYAFKDRALLQLALTHPSYVLNYGTNPDHARNTLSNCGVRKPRYGDKRNNFKYSKKKGIVHLINIMAQLEDLNGSQSFIEHNQRLEFLGDAVLEFICTAHLFFLFPEMSEGSLVNHRSSLVRNKHLAAIAKKLELDLFMRFSHGPDLCHQEDMDHALANCFEALLGAIYLDSGLHTVRKMFCEHAFDEIELRELWCNLRPHPLQVQQPKGDRHFIQCSEVLKKLVKLEESIGFQFDHIRLLARAFMHPSVPFNNLTFGNNQRMEFLGDAIIQWVTTAYLYRHFPDHHEGHLTLLRSSLVNNNTQAQIAVEIGLNLYVNFGIGQIIPKLRQKHLADLFEAFLAAMFIDKGLEPVEVFCKVCLFPRLKAVIMNQGWLDAKSQLQACCVTQVKHADKLLVYKVLKVYGSAEMKHFTVGVYFNGKRLGTGQGESTREAEMKAAQHALKSNYFPELARQKKVLHAKHKHLKMKQASSS